MVYSWLSIFYGRWKRRCRQMQRWETCCDVWRITERALECGTHFTWCKSCIIKSIRIFGATSIQQQQNLSKGASERNIRSLYSIWANRGTQCISQITHLPFINISTLTTYMRRWIRIANSLPSLHLTLETALKMFVSLWEKRQNEMFEG